MRIWLHPLSVIITADVSSSINCFKGDKMSIVKLRQLPTAIALVVASSQLHAAGFAANELSTNGLGRANAGEAAIAEDASVLSHNPAGLPA